MSLPRYYSAGVWLLALTSLACLLMLAARVALTHSAAHVGLAWNLFLAWVPLALSLLLVRVARGRLTRYVLVPAVGVIWLLFYPNAPYLVTDLAHLDVGDSLGSWFDLTMLFSFALAGLLAGFVSLYSLQDLLARACGRAAGWLFVLAVFALSGLGVYLGRFLRWNSWDVFFNPFMIAGGVLDGLLRPQAHLRSMAFSSIFGAFFVVTYVALYALTRLQRRSHTRFARGARRRRGTPGGHAAL